MSKTAFPEEFLQEVSEKNDIVEVVSGYVRLGKRSGSNLFGLCPFHSEKTPSFCVSEDKQMYHCFGCGKGGGVINFVMEVENVSFPEAVEILAKKANLEIPENNDNSSASKKRARMYELNKAAARFFFEQLKTNDGSAAVSYMDNRKINPKTAVRFGLGFAPNTWNSLLRAMKAKGFSDNEMFEAGLIKRGKNGSFYDTFRGRLMFPVIDVKGNVIGFSGRILGDGEPKYLNSPETMVFNKSRNLFGLNLAKKSKAGNIILCEGNVDVVSMHQAGFDSAVASLGTSLTDEQAKLISRYTNEVVIAYDNDNAGKKATQRAIGILEKLDLKVKVLQMKGAKDPDEFIKTKGADSFRKLINESEGQLDFRLQTIKDKYDLSSDEQKIDFLKESTDMLARLPGQLERQVYAMRVASLTGIDASVILDDVNRKRNRILKDSKYRMEKNSHPERQAQPENKQFRYENTVSATAEEGIINLLMIDQELLKSEKRLDVEDFSSDALRNIYKVICDKADKNENVNIPSLSGAITPEEMNLLVSILQKPVDKARRMNAWDDYYKIIKEQNEFRNSSGDLRALAEKFKEDKGYGD